MSTSALTFQSAKFHRNGVGGDGYYAIRFRLGNVSFGAVVFEQANEERPSETFNPGCIAILDNEGNSWRYEDFADQLLSFIASPLCASMCWPLQRAANDA